MKTDRLNYYRRLAHQGNKNAQRVVDAFDPDQPRDPDGKWGEAGGVASQHEKEARQHEAAGRFGRAAGSYFQAGREHAKAGRYKEEGEARGNELRVRQLSASKEKIPPSNEKTFGHYAAAAEHAGKLAARNPRERYRVHSETVSLSGGPPKFSVQKYKGAIAGWNRTNEE